MVYKQHSSRGDSTLVYTGWIQKWKIINTYFPIQMTSLGFRNEKLLP